MFLFKYSKFRSGQFVLNGVVDRLTDSIMIPHLVVEASKNSAERSAFESGFKLLFLLLS
jgi:hypothetical protein